ncbi:hypothetical protein BX600DRAFT_533176 [Xylariales sp. PMI_506]|nr:hypothetical protein BX600DRAFT_533176 [Xylariales sp. PMI_506]
MIRCGIKKSNVPGTLTFLVLRTADPFIQYKILGGLGSLLLTKAGILASPQSPAFLSVPTFDRLALPLPHLILLGMSVGSALKQNYWLVALSAEEFPPSSALAVGIFNSVFNSINSFLLISVFTSALSGTASSTSLRLGFGSCLYAIGITLETVSEWQRKKFKDDPKSQGKVMTSGLWSWARHINYGGYTLWRAGYCIAASGFVTGALVGGFFVYDFLHRATFEACATLKLGRLRVWSRRFAGKDYVWP